MVSEKALAHVEGRISLEIRRIALSASHQKLNQNKTPRGKKPKHFSFLHCWGYSDSAQAATRVSEAAESSWCEVIFNNGLRCYDNSF